MSTFRTSSPTERAFRTDKQWQHPSRREHIHGRVRPANDSRSRSWFWIQFAIYAACTVYALKIWVIG